MILKALLGFLEGLLKLLVPVLLAYRQGRTSERLSASQRALEYHDEADRIDARSMSVRDALSELRRRSDP